MAKYAYYAKEIREWTAKGLSDHEIVEKLSEVTSATLEGLRNFRYRNEIPLDHRSKSKYDWKSWFDGGYHTIKRGEDFTSAVSAVRQTIYMAAERWGGKANTSADGDTITFRFIPNGMQDGNSYKPQNIYDWAKWLDGEEHTITRGKDFTTEVKSMRVAIYRASYLEGGKATTSADGDTIIFRFIKC